MIPVVHSMLLFAFVISLEAALPPGGAPFLATLISQPVPGALRGRTNQGWKVGRLCDVGKKVINGTNVTAILQQAIDECGDLPGGGTVLIPPGLTLLSASLFLRSNLTFRIEGGSRLVSTATGAGRQGSASLLDAPLVYTRRNSLMVTAHAGLLNGGRCLRMKLNPRGGDDCAEWHKLSNVVIEGKGTIDGDGDAWYRVYGVEHPERKNLRPVLLDLLWVDGLTIREVTIRRPGYWTVHPCFCNNVRMVNTVVDTWNLWHAGSNTDGVDPDSSWNVYIADNSFSTGDDCISIKAGRDWSGRLVNISTVNVLAERNRFRKGHGVTIGSETSGWIRNVTIRDSVLAGADLAVRIKTARGRGGGAEDILFQNLIGTTQAGIQFTLDYDVPPAPRTNSSATPVIRRVTLRNVTAFTQACTGASVGEVCALSCTGLVDSEIRDIRFDAVRVAGGAKGQSCHYCAIDATNSTPVPNCTSSQEVTELPGYIAYR